MKTNFILAVGLMMSLCACSPQKEITDIRLNTDNIPEVVRAMTLEEKAELVTGGGMKSMMAGLYGEKGVLVPGAGGVTREIERLGIPSIVLSDGPAGVRIEPERKRNKGKTYYATAFPSGTLLASTWNEELVGNVGKALGNEVLEYGIDVLLAPGMNLQRNPLNGRNFEYYSEDPVLTGKIAAAMISGIQSNGVGTSAKHFALNSQETRRNGNDARADERTIRELYLKGFEIAVKESSPWTIMSSYNRINGEWAQSNRWLLTDVLRTEWGYEGTVITDWTGKRNSAAQISAGNDLMEPGKESQRREVLRKVKSGELKESELDACVERVLSLIVKTPRFKGFKYSDEPDLASHAKVSRTAAAEGMVLLKNEDVLPMTGTRRIALFGNAGYRTIVSGTGSGNVHAPYTINISSALETAGYSLDDNVESCYTEYLARNKQKGGMLANMLGHSLAEEMAVPLDLINPAYSDVAIVVIGRQAGEGMDRHLEDDFLLSETEMDNLENIASAFHSASKRVIVILNTGGVIETSSWNGCCDALIAMWQLGQEGASALADMISGRINPSGKLAATFPVNYMDVPSSENFPYDYHGRGSMNSFSRYRDKGVKNIDYTEYREGLNVGYRYFSTTGKETAYPFGFGLSYTSFSYENLEASVDANGSVNVSVKVTNTGERAGKDAVQIYVSDPAPNISKPSLELKAFAKTGTLAPGESETLRMAIPQYILASFNDSKHCWECPSRLILSAASSSSDIRLSVELQLQNK